MEKYDFSGWATRNDLLCGDGRTIRKNAFSDCDGTVVSLIWNHDHSNPEAVLGHALLKNKEDGVYAYCKFNDTEAGINAKKLVENGDVRSLSIYANKLKQVGSDVIHGVIREVSLVLAGANPGAYIDFVMAHGDDGEDSLIANYDESAIVLYHSDDKSDKPKEENEEEKTSMATEEKNTKPSGDGKEETVEDVFNTLSEKQKTVVYAMIGAAIENAGSEKENEKEGKSTMKHNVFDNEENTKENTLSHSDMETIISEAKRYGSLKDSAIAHGADNIICHSDGDYGITNIDYLFPEAKTLTNVPSFISRDMGWVSKVMGGVHKTPFSKIKSVFANITADDARARGYVKGNIKLEEVFTLLKRTTEATTIYKKQKMDRDDVTEITDFDVVAFIKSEMRVMLDEEIARAILVGDGRSSASDDKIKTDNVRPIWTDDALYTIKKKISLAANDTNDQKAKKFIQAAVRARKDYKGSGNPTLFTTEDVLTDCLLMEDTTGRVIYDSVEKLATALRVKEIVTTQVMENLTRTGVQAVDGDTDTRTLMGIIVNLQDYNLGADKGGAVSMFDDFDIDYNQQKYLIETRCSGALTVPYSAIALEAVSA